MGNYVDVGEPITVPNKCIRIYPLFYTKGSHAREYRLIEEIENKVTMVDSGNIDKLYIKNHSKYPVFIRSGNILVGNTQNRTLKRSMVILPSTKKRGFSDIPYTKTAEVYCVHASSPINQSGTFGTNCLMPHEYDTLAYSGGNQNQVWAFNTSYSSDSSYVPITGSVMSSDVMTPITFKQDNMLKKVKKVQETYADVVDKIMKDSPWILDSIGVAIVDSVGILAVELFDSKESWEVFCEKLMRKYGPDFGKRTRAYTGGNYWKNMKQRIKDALNMNFRVLNVFKDSTRTGRKTWTTVTYQGNVGDRFEGELTKLNKKVIHFAMVRGTKYQGRGTELGPMTVHY